MKERNQFIYQFFALILVFTIVCGNFSAFAQVKSKATAAKCSGAWTGSITYSRYQKMTDNKTTPRVSGRGEDKRDWEMIYDYKASVAVTEAPENNGSSIGKATITHNFSSTEKITAVEKNSCDRGKTWQDMRGESTSKSLTTGTGDRVEANVNVGVNTDGSYTVSVGLPQIKGETSGSQTSSFSGQCTPKEGKNFNMPPSPTTIDGNSLTSDGSDRINPSDPNRISGSYSKTWQNVTEKITWTLQKCGAPLRISDLKFEDMKFPNWNDWQEISEQVGTIDGNFVRIKAKIFNGSGETKYADLRFKETYKGDKWDGARPDAELKDSTVSVRLEAGEEKEVELLWDSSGYSWYDDGRPRLVQRIKVELEENGKKIDEMTKNLKVAPKPVVLVHGLWSNWHAFETWQNIFTTSHSYDWKAFPVGEKAEHGTMDTGGEFLSSNPTKSIEQNARALQAYINYAQKDRNAWHIDVVAHSMGGLITRYYIQNIMPKDADDFRPQIAHLVMLGTPNQGSPCADLMDSAYRLVGKDVEALRQLRTDVVNKFNGLVFNQKGVKFSALAGNPLPTICYRNEPNDGVVHVPSAIYRVKDNALSKSIHTELTGTTDFSNFVKPHLAIGPKGDHNPAPPDFPSGFGLETTRNPARAFFVNAAYNGTENLPGENDIKPDFAKAVRVAAKGSVEIEIPVEAALNFGLTFMASNEISATLFNDKGLAVGKNLTKTSEANAWFRSIYFDKAVTSGTWKLKLENASDRELEAIVATWKTALK